MTTGTSIAVIGSVSSIASKACPGHMVGEGVGGGVIGTCAVVGLGVVGSFIS